MGTRSKKIAYPHRCTVRGPLSPWRLEWALRAQHTGNRADRRTAKSLLRHHTRTLTAKQRRLLNQADVPKWVLNLIAPFQKFLKVKKGVIR